METTACGSWKSMLDNRAKADIVNVKTVMDAYAQRRERESTLHKKASGEWLNPLQCMIEIDCGTCPQLGRPRSHLGLVYAGTDQAGHDGNRFQTYDCLRRLTGSRRPPFRVLGHPEVGGIGVYMHENAASHVHDNTFEQCEASQKKKRSEASMCDIPYCPLRASRPPAQHKRLPSPKRQRSGGWCRKK